MGSSKSKRQPSSGLDGFKTFYEALKRHIDELERRQKKVEAVDTKRVEKWKRKYREFDEEIGIRVAGMKAKGWTRDKIDAAKKGLYAKKAKLKKDRDAAILSEREKAAKRGDTRDTKWMKGAIRHLKAYKTLIGKQDPSWRTRGSRRGGKRS